MSETKVKREKPWMRTVQGTICLFLILSGMFLCLESILETGLPCRTSLLAAAVLSFALQPVQRG